MIRSRLLPALLAAVLLPGRRRPRKSLGVTACPCSESRNTRPISAHFDYVNPDAPKGGLVRSRRAGPLRQLQPVRRRREGRRSRTGIGLVYDTLMTAALDEIEHRIRAARRELCAIRPTSPPSPSGCAPEARWHDGQPVTRRRRGLLLRDPQGEPARLRLLLRQRDEGRADGRARGHLHLRREGQPRTAADRRAAHRPAEALVGGNGADGRKRDVTQTTLEPPLGSGPYRLKSFDAGRTAGYERVPDYWGKDLQRERRARTISTRSASSTIRDSTVLLEAFKGDRYDLRTENSARNWATAYDFPAVKEGRVVLEEFPDARLRRHAGLRLQPAPADNSRTSACGAPSTTPSTSRTSTAPSSSACTSASTASSRHRARLLRTAGGPGAGDPGERARQGRRHGLHDALHEPGRRHAGGVARQPARGACRLLQEAGYELKRPAARQQGNGRAAHHRVPELRPEPGALRAALQAGAGAASASRVTLRIVDHAQYQNRLRTSTSTSPRRCGRNRSRPATSSATSGARKAADRPGSRNLAGIKDPGVDALIERVIFAKDRDELVAATQALDRVLLAHNYVVPQWYLAVIPHRALEPLRPARDVAGHCGGFPDDLVVGRGARPQKSGEPP